MPLQPGARLGVYEISTLVGVGGMGEIYRATDTTLKRQVAIKVLPDSVARDGDRLARFQREAEILAALNHPNIAQVFGFEKADGASALVMELVEGPTLADRIAQGPVPIHETVAIARQIVDALEAAHEQGIIHRDLKPANIKVRPDGTVKVLDFGLAKAMEAHGLTASTPHGLENSPTFTSPAMTMAGMILGTAPYMSPEQAAGKPVDKRSDVWAFGVVLMEMLTGRQTFGGETVSHVIASVLKDAPDWTALPPGTPTPIRALLRRCLEKDRRRRLADIADARFDLDEALTAVSELPTVAADRSPARAWMWAALGVVAGAFIAAAATWTWIRPAAQPSRPARFNLTFPPNEPLAYRGPSGNLAISPDGSFIVYSAAAATGQGPRLMIRSMDDLAPKPLPDTETAHAPFVSPDGAWWDSCRPRA